MEKSGLSARDVGYRIGHLYSKRIKREEKSARIVGMKTRTKNDNPRNDN